jgi:hypothetical protein
MFRLLLVVLAILAGQLVCRAQLPAEGSVLTYLLVGFQWPATATGAAYEVQVARGYCTDSALFIANRMRAVTTLEHRTIVELPEFGAHYSWRVMANGGQLGAIHHFETKMPPTRLKTRLTVAVNTGKYDSSYFFVDGNSGLYSAAGKLLWFPPAIAGADTTPLRDLRHTSAHTITMLVNERLVEIGYSGNLLWSSDRIKAPAGTAINFHHEFVRLANGHYMSMGNDQIFVNRATGVSADGTFRGVPGLVPSPEMEARQRDLAKMPTLAEFDAAGNLVWQWRSATYFAESDIYYHHGVDRLPDFNPHGNAFWFNEADGKIYVSFKNLNRIVCVSYPDGKVTAQYGDSYTAERTTSDKAAFHEQHSVGVHPNGNLYLLNNGLSREKGLPSVIEFRPQAAPAVQATWQYTFHPNLNRFTEAELRLPRHGGSVRPVPGTADYFVCMCSPFWNLYVISGDKKVLYEALPETWNAGRQKWEPTFGYRADMVSRQELEQMIWAGQPAR